MNDLGPGHTVPIVSSAERRHAGDRDVQPMSHSAGDNPRDLPTLSLLVQSKPCCLK